MYVRSSCTSVFHIIVNFKSIKQYDMSLDSGIIRWVLCYSFSAQYHMRRCIHHIGYLWYNC